MNAFPSSTTLNQSAAWPLTPTPAARNKRADAIASDAESTSRKRHNSEEDLYPASSTATAATGEAQKPTQEASEWQPYDMSKHVAQPGAGPSSFEAPRATALAPHSGEARASGSGSHRSEYAIATPRVADISLGSFSFSRHGGGPTNPSPVAPSQWLPNVEADSPENVSLILRKSSGARSLYRSAKVSKVTAAREQAEAQVVSAAGREPQPVVKDPTLKAQPQWIPAGRVELMGRVKWNTLMWAALVVVPRAAAFQAVYWMLLDSAYFVVGSDKWISAMVFGLRWLLILTSIYNIGDAVVRIRSLSPTEEKPKRAPNAPPPNLHGPSGSKVPTSDAAAKLGELSTSAWEEQRDRKPFTVYEVGALRRGMEAARRSASRGIAMGDESVLGRSFSSSFNGDVSRSGVDWSSPLAPRASAPGGGLYGANRRLPTGNSMPPPNEAARKPSNMSAYFARSSGAWANATDEYASDSLLVERAVSSLKQSLVNPQPVKPIRRAAAGSEVLPVEDMQQITPVIYNRSPAGAYVAPAAPWYTPSWIVPSSNVSKVNTPTQAGARTVVSLPAAPRTPAPGGTRSAEEAAGVDALL